MEIDFSFISLNTLSFELRLFGSIQFINEKK